MSSGTALTTFRNDMLTLLVQGRFEIAVEPGLRESFRIPAKGSLTSTSKRMTHDVSEASLMTVKPMISEVTCLARNTPEIFKAP